MALANGINANLLRRWIEQGGQRLPSADSGETTMDMQRDHAKAALVPVHLGATPSPAAPDIRIELKRGATTVVVNWPSSGRSGERRLASRDLAL
ncbi:transposase-like protein [Variovorax sp. OAS795]|uniref:hypothetical protein n=1 Tax=Variovorax sp. OAS795 TaxID=3034231 RepID=UPI003399528F